MKPAPKPQPPYVDVGMIIAFASADAASRFGVPIWSMLIGALIVGVPRIVAYERWLRRQERRRG